MLSTPLFAGFSETDLAAVIHGLELLTFEPGDILVAEGAPGDSLFILSTGSVKCYVRNPKGHYMKVHTLKEGDFFGEISVLTGKPRTATLVAGEYCEVLELNKANLDAITKTHPQVRKVLKDFHEQRAQSTIKAMIKNKGSRPPCAASPLCCSAPCFPSRAERQVLACVASAGRAGRASMRPRWPRSRRPAPTGFRRRRLVSRPLWRRPK